MRRSIWMVAVCVLVASSYRAIGQEETPLDLQSKMEELTRAFRGMSRSLAVEDVNEATVQAGLLERALSDVTAGGKRPVSDEMKGYFLQLESIATELASLAAPEEIVRARQLLEDIRKTCVTCHARLRSRNDERGIFPAKGNTVAGQVAIQILDSDEQREDGSGVVVFVESDTGSRTTTPRQTVTIFQKGSIFSPRVVAIPRGSRVRFPNDDTIFHNVFSLSKAKPFDLGVYAQGQEKSVRFPKSGLIKVYCNIHPEMIANIVVLNSAHFSVTDEDGRYAIPQVPDGTYTLRAWHEFGGETTQKITLAGGAPHEFPIQIQETKRTLRHKNKFGEPYRRKYK